MRSNSIESAQKRYAPYNLFVLKWLDNALDVADIASLSTRRNELSRNFFHSSSLHSLLPPPPRSWFTCSSSSPHQNPAYPHELEKYQSFVSYAISRYQTDSIFTSITRLYDPSSFQLYMYMLSLNHFTFPRFNCFCLCMYLFSLQAIYAIKSLSLSICRGARHWSVLITWLIRILSLFPAVCMQQSATLTLTRNLTQIPNPNRNPSPNPNRNPTVL